MNPSRRQVLNAGVGTCALLLPQPWTAVWAQSEAASRLLKAPKVALVIGNAAYPRAALRNPANDARAMAQALRKIGFEVAVRVDVGRQGMTGALSAYVQALAEKRAVGLFYYAGHGVQLAWRNYMLPVDAEPATIADVAPQGVDLNALMEGISKAGNPMNIVILDACRDNPFGSLEASDQKGLSQMDAPQATLLAYATGPGNVASDGAGANGLYTEHLLREMAVPGARIEDIFKRVRLGVRKDSNGRQIPWESTSLENDFWLIPPREFRDLSDQERDRDFEEQLAQWQRSRDSNDVAALFAFLRRYPSGDFAELALLRLGRLLAANGEQAVRVASQEGNPYTSGAAQANMEWRAGDSYTYRRTDRLNAGESRDIVQTVVQVTDAEVRYGDGTVTDPLGNLLHRGRGRAYSPNQVEPLEYAVGRQWTTQYRITTPKGVSGRNEMALRIVGRERVSVPAGTFSAFRIEGRGVFEEESGRVEVTTLTKWVAPQALRREIAMEEVRERSGGPGHGSRTARQGHARGRVTRSMRWELSAYKQT